MRKEDIAQVSEIDREAFPTQWPPNYQNELRNRLAHYIVACDEEKIIDEPVAESPSKKGLNSLKSRLKRLLLNNRFNNNESPPPIRHYIAGFAGFWIMADEAHVTSIAVRETCRQQGIGELLLISVIDLAAELKARIVTLEVRASNNTAQSLYNKYGFTHVGKRRGYYVDRGYPVDQREDAVLMSTKDIALADFQSHLQQLKQAHSRKSGIALFQICR